MVHDGIMAFLELWRKIARLRDLSALKPVVDIVTEIILRTPFPNT